VRVVTTTPTFADITRQVGGDLVKVETIMRGPEDVHNVIAKPSSMMKLRRADLVVHGGLDGEPWAPLLIKGARVPRLLYGQPGNVDVSVGIALKEIPDRGGLSRALGDIHVYGNTHYPMDPLNGIIVAGTIARALEQADPAHRAEYESGREQFAQRIRALTERLEAEMAPYRGTPVVTYHRSWPYFLDRFGLHKVAEVEPKPGITPGPQHLSACVAAMNAAGARIVIFEPFNNRKTAEAVAKRAGGVAVLLAGQVDALPDVKTYEALFEHDVEALLAAFAEAGIEPHQPAPAATGSGS
jgi:ABC-type Zn uptake system ZnuABC Zn-binding protein ZnuA